MKKLLSVFAAFLCLLAPALAQNVGIGAYPFSSFDNRGFDSVNLGNLNVRFSIPIVNRTGRGIPFNYAIQYEGLVWSATGGVWKNDPAWGFQGSLNGTIIAGNLTYSQSQRPCSGSGHVPPDIRYFNYVYQDPFGGSHRFNYSIDFGCGTADPTITGTGLATDNSGYSLYNGQSQIKARNGAIITPAMSAAGGGQSIGLTDSNGNQVTSPGNGVYTDTLGVNALTVSGSAPTATTLTYPVALQSNGATTAAATVSYKTYALRTKFQVPNVVDVGQVSTTTANLVDQITLADGASVYNFTYEGTPGASDGAVTGRLASIKLPNGGVISYAYSGCASSTGMGADGSPCLLTRTTSDGSRQYYHGAPSSGHFSNYMVDEAGNRTDYTFAVGTNGNPYELHRTVNQGGTHTASSSLEERDLYYNGDYSQANPVGPIAQYDVTEAQNGNRISHTITTVNSNTGLPGNFYQLDNADNHLRLTTYAYDGNNNLTDQLTTVGPNNSMFAHTTYGYDETAVTGTSGIPQHSAPSGSRNNVTSTHQYYNSSTAIDSTATYYDTGVVKSSKTPLGSTTYGYDSTQGFTTATSLPTPSSGVAQNTAAAYNTASAALTSATGLNPGQTVTLQTYDRLMRPLAVNMPDGGSSTLTYWAGGNTVAAKIDGSRSTNQQTLLDGYGRVRRTSTFNGSAWYVTDTCYGPMGIAQYVSVPYTATVADPSGNHCAGSTADTYAYDALGRVTQVTHPDGTHRNLSYLIYNGAFSTETTDENGSTRIIDTDALGRNTISCEVTNQVYAGYAPGQCNTAIENTGFKTSFAYDEANHITTITQGAQTRTFQTDALGRTVKTVEPERGITTYAYNYAYPGLIVTRTRPTANQTNPAVTTTTTTQYDALSRPVDIAYATSFAGGTHSPERQFYYDRTPDGHVNSGSGIGLLAGASTITGDSNNSVSRYGYDIMGRLNTSFDCVPGWCSQLTSRAMYRGYSYDYAGNKTVESWTFGYSGSNQPSVGLSYTYTNAGELDTMLGGLNDGAQPLAPYFYKAGAHTPYGPQSEQFGNSLQRNAIFDSMGRDVGKFVCRNTIQPDCGGGGYVYGYRDNIVGQRTTHLEDTATQLNSNMHYDDVGRLSSLTATSGLNMSWTYDRYGNRYQQAGSGGGVTVPQPSFGIDPPTNRILATGFSYDAAGNLLTDSQHTYTYDAEGNVVMVDNGNTAVDYYDAQNRRVAHSGAGVFRRYEYNNEGKKSDIWYDEEQYERTARYFANGQNFAYWSSNGGPAAGGKLHFQHPDLIGTVRARTTDVGALEGSYFSLPFGDGYSYSGTDDNAEHFALLERNSETDTQQATFRKLSSSWGRWLSPDPYDGSYDPSNPQSLNRYAYASNNPLSLLDPSGLDPIVIPGYGDGTTVFSDPEQWFNCWFCHEYFGIPPIVSASSSGNGGGGGGGGSAAQNTKPPTPPSVAPSNTAKRLACAAKYGQAHSVGAAFGGGKVASFLGGNAVSSLLNLGLAATGNGPSPNPVKTYLSGPALGIPVNDALRLAGRPGIQGIGSASGAVRGAGLTGIFNAATESGGIASIAADGGEIAVQGGLEAGEFASGIGIAKFGYDALTVAYGYAFGCPK